MKWDSCFLNSFSATEGSDRYYPPQEEETNEIERQQAQVRDTRVRTRSDDTDRNEVISTQQMCKSSRLFIKNLLFYVDADPFILYLVRYFYNGKNKTCHYIMYFEL